MRIILTLLLVSCSLLVNAQKVYDKPMLTYVNDIPVRSFVTDNVELFMSVELNRKMYSLGKELRVNLFVKNKGKVPIYVGPDMMEVYVTKYNGKQTTLKVYSLKEYNKMIEKNILWFGPDNTEKVNTTSTVTDDSGKKTGEVTTSTEVYTGAATEAYREAEDFVNANYLKRNTLLGGQEAEGFVAVKSPKGKPIEIKIELGGDVFMFKFEDYDE